MPVYRNDCDICMENYTDNPRIEVMLACDGACRANGKPWAVGQCVETAWVALP